MNTYKFGTRIQATMPVSSVSTGIVANLPDQLREMIVVNDKGGDFVTCSDLADGFSGRVKVLRSRIVEGSAFGPES